MRCVFHDSHQDRKNWREAFDNLIKYGPLDPQTMFIQGWVHEDLEQHTQDNFNEDWMTRFLRMAAEEGISSDENSFFAFDFLTYVAIKSLVHIRRISRRKSADFSNKY